MTEEMTNGERIITVLRDIAEGKNTDVELPETRALAQYILEGHTEHKTAAMIYITQLCCAELPDLLSQINIQVLKMRLARHVLEVMFEGKVGH